MKLNELRDNLGAKKSRVRVGRGLGSGLGKTCGAGQKGQKARSGVAIKGFEGGQMPLHRRLPKRGFNNINSKEFAVFNLDQLQNMVDGGQIKAGDVVTESLLRSISALKGRYDGVKILGTGELKASLKFEVDRVSETAQKAIEKAGGSVTLINA